MMRERRPPQQTVMELEVKCLWRTLLHDSKVTDLAVSEKDRMLYSACAEVVSRQDTNKKQGLKAVGNGSCQAHDLTALRPAVVKATDCSTGTQVLSLSAPESDEQRLCRTISSLQLPGDHGYLTCVAGDCSLWRWHLSDSGPMPSPDQLSLQSPEIICQLAASPLQPKQQQSPMPSPITVSRLTVGGDLVAYAGQKTLTSGTPDEKAGQVQPGNKSAGKERREHGAIRPCNATEDRSDSPHAQEFFRVLSALKAENFIKATGYRGARDGFTYRNGPWGRGYYSKDILRDGLVHTVPPNEDFSGKPRLEHQADGPRTLTGAATGNRLASGDEVGIGHGSAGVLSDNTQEGSTLPEAQTEEEVLLGMPAERRERQAVISQMLAARPVLRCSVLSADGTVLYTGSWGSEDTKARSWDIREGGRPIACFDGHTANVLSLALSPDEGKLYSGSYDSTICEWDTSSGEMVQQLRGHRSGVHGLCVSPDGLQLFSCGADNTVRVWDLQHGCCLRTMEGRHEDTTWPVCISLTRDGELLATGSNGLLGQSTVKIFHVAGFSHRDSGKCLATLTHFTSSDTGSRSISALAFSPCGDMLFSGGSDGTVAGWKLQRSVTAKGKSKFKTGFLA